ncbi:sialate O-acetylesterase [Pedobacter sp. ASV1-7]|uniref:sialate O-acetylesterase n=1 Tax=Pedobacter sp. ASV1-7 TaxID=3145237 RepID=UPI0032E8552C
MKKVIKYLSLVIIGIALGILANRNREYLINAQFIRDHLHFRKVLSDKNNIVNAPKVMVCLTFGQSNAGNYGNGKYTCRNDVYNYYKGELYKAEEPLLGPDGGGSSVWTRVADMLIDSGLYDKVVIVPCAIGGTSVKCWSEGYCKDKLIKTLDYLRNDKIKLTHIFWDQGETDNVDNTSTNEYKGRLKEVIKIIRDMNFDAPFYTSISSYFPYNNENLNGIDQGIVKAQEEVIKEVANVKRGPNTDSLNLAYYRADAVHFTEKGLDELAKKWFESIRQNNR